MLLLVDDNPDNLVLLSSCLQDEDNVELTVALNGASAIEQVELEQPDLILMDIIMPGMSGLDVCAHLKADPSTSQIPIILVSALSAQDSVIEGLKLGAVDYITKPYNADELRARVRLHLKLRLLTKSLIERNARLQREINQREAAESALVVQQAFAREVERQVKERTRELREAQARVIQLEKDATEMQMAGGFAHEMRNALVGAQLMMAKVSGNARGGANIVSFTESYARLRNVLRSLHCEAPPSMLDEVRDAIARADADAKMVAAVFDGVGRALVRGLDLTTQILAYADVAKAMPGDEPVPMRALVDGLLDELAESFASNQIEVTVDVDPACTLVGSDPHFYLLLRHLVINAQDALCEVETSAPRTLAIQVVETPEQMVLTVRDSGVGIPAHLRQQIFEPFFSTKGLTGKGLGLGIVRKLTTLYGGSIELESAPTQGVAFRLTFPRRTPGGATHPLSKIARGDAER